MNVCAMDEAEALGGRLSAALRRVIPGAKPAATLADAASVSPSMAEKILSGEKLPSMTTLHRIALAFGPQIIAETLCPETEWAAQARVDARLADLRRRTAELHRDMEALCP